MSAINTAVSYISELVKMPCNVSVSIENVVFSNIFPEKQKRLATYHYFPSIKSIEAFMKEFDGLISDDMFNPKIKHVNLFNIQIHLPV